MIDTRDILLKAAEDVQSGMWCKGAMFRHPDESYGVSLIPGDAVSLTPEQLSQMKRCATGSIALATMQLGGGHQEYRDACERASTWVELPDEDEELDFNPEVRIIHFNDCVLSDDPFEAGQQLAELFRTAAEAL